MILVCFFQKCIHLCPFIYSQRILDIMNYHPTLYCILRLSFICPSTIHLFSSYGFSFTQWIFSYPFILVTSSILYYSSLSAYFYPCLYPSFTANISFIYSECILPWIHRPSVLNVPSVLSKKLHFSQCIICLSQTCTLSIFNVSSIHLRYILSLSSYNPFILLLS